MSQYYAVLNFSDLRIFGNQLPLKIVVVSAVTNDPINSNHARKMLPDENEEIKTP